MAEQAPLYDLVLLLSLGAPDEQRAKVLADVEAAITGAGGSIERNDDWGRRPTTFEIRHQSEAEYHLLQFKSPPELIEELSHTLHITDGVLRFRVIKNRPGTPPAPSSPPPVVAAASASGAGTGGGAPRADDGRGGAERASAAVALADDSSDDETTDES
jgi:small subunit ribosomal protein S6